MHLQVETTSFASLKLLSELTWYHNGSVILPDRDGRVTFSDDNKTLTIATFTPADAGLYKAQFNRLSVQPYNQSCNENFTQLLRNYPVFAPAIYCINVNSCPDDAVALQFQRVSIRRQNILSGESLFAEVTGSDHEEFEQFLYLQWYRSGDYITSRNSGVEINSSIITYEATERYEALLSFDLRRYRYSNAYEHCQAFYRSQLIAPYTYAGLPISWGFTDVIYYRSKH